MWFLVTVAPKTGVHANRKSQASVIIMDKWSLSDKQVYGAEDDQEMDAIMSAIDAALDRESDDKSRS